MKEAEVHQSEAKRDAQLKGAEVIKIVQVQYGIGKWFKPEAKEYKPVVLDESKGKPKTEMTEALKQAVTHHLHDTHKQHT